MVILQLSPEKTVEIEDGEIRLIPDIDSGLIADIQAFAESVPTRGSDPFPDLTLAEAIQSQFGGEITKAEEPEFDPDTVY